MLAGQPAALRLLPFDFTDQAAWRAAAERAATRNIAPGLLDELVRQARALPPSAARDRHLERLARPGTSVVVTGQQVGLFGGPLYTLHKAATAIARARLVEQLTGRPCVPLFWLQTEDHDYAEIAQVAFAGASERVVLALPPEPTPARVALAHRVLPVGTQALLDQLQGELASLPQAAQLLTLLRAHYVVGRPIAAAFGGLLAELFEAEGLLVLDPRVPAVARLSAPLLQRVLDDHTGIASALHARAASIAAAGCEEQVRTRDTASLVFFHPSGLQGPRYRLTRTADGFATPEGPVSARVLAELLVSEPLRFSTSALLRPLVQDTLLPSCAYVGGPAELSYFAQLPPIYERLGIPMPMIAPRARLRVIDPATRSLLGRVGLSPSDLDEPLPTLLARVVAHKHGALAAAELRARLFSPLQRELDALLALGLEGLADPIRKTRQTCEQSITKLAERAERAALERDQITSTRLARLILALRPDGVAQERAYGFLALAARTGHAALTRAILAAASSLDPAVCDVYP